MAHWSGQPSCMGPHLHVAFAEKRAVPDTNKNEANARPSMLRKKAIAMRVQAPLCLHYLQQQPPGQAWTSFGKVWYSVT
eukprot:724578-Pelagomonas_calceolata.AAC.2